MYGPHANKASVAFYRRQQTELSQSQTGKPSVITADFIAKQNSWLEWREEEGSSRRRTKWAWKSEQYQIPGRMQKEIKIGVWNVRVCCARVRGREPKEAGGVGGGRCGTQALIHEVAHELQAISKIHRLGDNDVLYSTILYWAVQYCRLVLEALFSNKV